MTEWLGVISTAIAAVGLVFAGVQVRNLNRQTAHDQRVATEGVVVAWRPKQAPDTAGPDGHAQWQYIVSVHNPGRLPIDDIRVRWVFPIPVQRTHAGGIVDPPATEIDLGTPVLPGGAEREWSRWLRIDFDHRHLLRNIYAEVSFNDIDGRPHTNRWPRKAGKP